MSTPRARYLAPDPLASLRATIADLTLDNERLRADLGHMLRERIRPVRPRTGPPRRLP